MEDRRNLLEASVQVRMRCLPTGWLGAMTVNGSKGTANREPTDAGSERVPDKVDAGHMQSSPAARTTRCQTAPDAVIRLTCPNGDNFDTLEDALKHVFSRECLCVRTSVGCASDSMYQVKGVLAERVHRGVRQVLVYWEGYPRDSATWEPIANIPALFVDSFRQGQPIDEGPGADTLQMDTSSELPDAHVVEMKLRDSVNRGLDEGTTLLGTVWKRLSLFGNIDRISHSDWEALKDALVIPHVWCRVCACTRSTSWQASIYGPQTLCAPCSDFLTSECLLLPLQEPSWPNCFLPDRNYQKSMADVSSAGSTPRKPVRASGGSACGGASGEGASSWSKRNGKSDTFLSCDGGAWSTGLPSSSSSTSISSGLVPTLPLPSWQPKRPQEREGRAAKILERAQSSQKKYACGQGGRNGSKALTLMHGKSHPKGARNRSAAAAAAGIAGIAEMKARGSRVGA